MVVYIVNGSLRPCYQWKPLIVTNKQALPWLLSISDTRNHFPHARNSLREIKLLIIIVVKQHNKSISNTLSHHMKGLKQQLPDITDDFCMCTETIIREKTNQKAETFRLSQLSVSRQKRVAFRFQHFQNFTTATRNTGEWVICNNNRNTGFFH